MKLGYKHILGTSFWALLFSFGISSQTLAQSCAIAPTCESLGYTQSASDCSGKPTLKCPFDTTKMFCLETENAASCDKPVVGAFLYSDMSCSTVYDGTKTTIGIIFDAERRLALALEQKNERIATQSIVVGRIPFPQDALNESDGKNNTSLIHQYCEGNTLSCPAIDYVLSYSTEGTQAGDWYLPASADLNAMYSNLEMLRTNLTQAGGSPLPYLYHWSSTQSEFIAALYIMEFNKGTVSQDSLNYMHWVRPVMQF